MLPFFFVTNVLLTEKNAEKFAAEKVCQKCEFDLKTAKNGTKKVFRFKFNLKFI